MEFRLDVIKIELKIKIRLGNPKEVHHYSTVILDPLADFQLHVELDLHRHYSQWGTIS